MVLILLSSTFFISGCDSKHMRICTTSYPIEYLLERIGGDEVEVCNISSAQAIQSAQIKHDYKKMLEDSDALFYMAGMEPYFDIYEQDIRDLGIDYVDLSQYGYYYDFQRYTPSLTNEATPVVPSAYYDGDVFGNVDTYKKDPFVWQDPLMMIATAETIRDYMVTTYPEKEDVWNENYKKLELDLTKLDARFQTIKDRDIRISFVSMTPSFGNWQNAFGIQVYPIILSKYGALPSDAQLQLIKQRIVDDGVTYIAHERNLNPEMEQLYEQLVKELGLTPINLSNLSSLSSEAISNNQDYLTIMYENFKVLESIGN